MSGSTLKVTIAMAMGAVLFGQVATLSAQQPTALPVLLNRIPKTPASPAEADKMLGGMQQVAGMAGLKADLDVHGETVMKIVGDADAKIRERMGATTENIVRGGTAAGLDMARMQNDPAYAKEMQAKMKAMSPAELMAMAAAMHQGMAAGVGPSGRVAVYDPPAVQEAAAAGRPLMLPDGEAAWKTATKRRWDAVARKVAAIEDKYAVLRAKYPPKVMCDGEGGGGDACKAAWAAYVAAVPQLMQLQLAHDAEVLAVEAPALEEQRAAVAEEVRVADRHLQAAQYGALSQELGNPPPIGTLDNVAVRHIADLVERFEDIVRRAAFVTHCGTTYFTKFGSSQCSGGQ